MSEEEDSAQSEADSSYLEVSLAGRRTFVVGDIHGCLAELVVLLDELDGKSELRPGDLLIFIGDYIDRGPDSKGVVEHLMERASKAEYEVVFLRGNHEEMLLSFLGSGGTGGEVYLINGGNQT
ncbi:MAG: serine/threonine protein phosphatase, partial [Bdellovibrionales bacterium]|nr:serine/threonine protein phosphatase [Bdellovibrionales bacterium]